VGMVLHDPFSSIGRTQFHFPGRSMRVSRPLSVVLVDLLTNRRGRSVSFNPSHRISLPVDKLGQILTVDYFKCIETIAN
jgi:hypothetical protein